jgi:hypothetical protein
MINNQLKITNIHGVTASSCSNADLIFQKTGDKNIYEIVIDDLMLVKYSDDVEFMNKVKSLPLDKKRLAILLSMSNDHYSWDKLREKITGNRVSKLEHLKDLVKMFRDFIKVADVERKLLGEVMSPMDELARPMVDLVEKFNTDFWKTPKKVLDSSAGIGTFLIICAAKFMNGLKNYPGLEDPEVRFKYIIENCLYYGELQSRNAFLWLCAIDPYDEYDTNTYFGSFLTDENGNDEFNKHMKNVWKVDNFDLIIQNPPYQILKETAKNKESKNPKTQPIWHLFVQKSLSILKESGYMVMVHPGGWRDMNGVFKETQNILKSKKILELRIFPFKTGLDIFKAKTNFDYYILKNEENSGTITEIQCENGVIERFNLLDLDYIPGENIKLIQSITSKNEETVNFLHSYSAYEPRKNFISKEKSDINKHPVVYMVSYKNVPTFIYSSINDRGHFGLPKVIWASGSSGVIIDYKGEYGLSPFSAAIVDDIENLENIKKALESERFIKDVMLFKNGLGHKYNNKVISKLKKDFWKDFI